MAGETFAASFAEAMVQRAFKGAVALAERPEPLPRVFPIGKNDYDFSTCGRQIFPLGKIRLADGRYCT